MKLLALVLGAVILPLPALADVEAGSRKSASCATCHGIDGNSPSGAYPNLAGQAADYLYKQIKDFKEGRRSNAIMGTMIYSLSDEDMHDLADFYSAQGPTPSTFHTDPDKVEAGRKVAREAGCTNCHQRNFKGAGLIPRVAGQQYNYVIKQLKDFRAGTRTNDGGLMQPFTKNLTDDQIKALANYLISLY